MKGFFGKPSRYEIFRAGFAACLMFNAPMVIYPWYYVFQYGIPPGMIIQPFDGAREMAFWSALPLFYSIGFLVREEKWLRRLGIFQTLGTVAVFFIPKF